MAKRYITIGERVVDVLNVDASSLTVGPSGETVVYYDRSRGKWTAITCQSPIEAIKELVNCVNEFERTKSASASLSDGDIKRISQRVFQILSEKLSR